MSFILAFPMLPLAWLTVTTDDLLLESAPMERSRTSFTSFAFKTSLPELTKDRTHLFCYSTIFVALVFPFLHLIEIQGRYFYAKFVTCFLLCHQYCCTMARVTSCKFILEFPNSLWNGYTAHTEKLLCPLKINFHQS